MAKPFAAIANKFGADFDLPLDKFRENIQPMQIPEIPNWEPKAVPGTIATPASCIAFLQNSEPLIPVPVTFGKA